eukprot:GILI01022012.1.p1 GENE.GILI01022012.1~~GILI01022012.1.p1  ORF type:complete len:238 (+),score=0.77 GILI01022012.1:82-795(+)
MDKKKGTEEISSFLGRGRRQVIILENPDGSFSEGTRPGEGKQTGLPNSHIPISVPFTTQPNAHYPHSAPPAYGYHTQPYLPGSYVYPDYDASNYIEDILYVFTKHQKCFIIFLIVQFLVEVVFNIMSVIYAAHTLQEVLQIYHTVHPSQVWFFFWLLFGVDCLFGFIYFVAGLWGTCKRRPSSLNLFGKLALLGMFAQMLLAYVNRFNVLVFCLRTMAFVYSRFLLNLLYGMYILPT